MAAAGSRSERPTALMQTNKKATCSRWLCKTARRRAPERVGCRLLGCAGSSFGSGGSRVGSARGSVGGAGSSSRGSGGGGVGSLGRSGVGGSARSVGSSAHGSAGGGSGSARSRSSFAHGSASSGSSGILSGVGSGSGGSSSVSGGFCRRSGRCRCGRRLFLLAAGSQGSGGNQGGQYERFVHFNGPCRKLVLPESTKTLI